MKMVEANKLAEQLRNALQFFIQNKETMNKALDSAPQLSFIVRFIQRRHQVVDQLEQICKLDVTPTTI